MKPDKKWIFCPICHQKTRIQLRKDTMVKNFPLFCPKCKEENLIDAANFEITILAEPDVKTQSR